MRARIAEAHLDLGRMHVDVDAARIDLEEQQVRGLPLAVQQVAVGFAHRVRQHAVAHEAAVDEQVLRVGARRAPACGVPARPYRRRLPACASTGKLASRNSRPSSAAARSPSGCARRCAETRPLCFRVKATSGRASAMRRNISSQWPNSVCSVRMNFLRAGVLK